MSENGSIFLLCLFILRGSTITSFTVDKDSSIELVCPFKANYTRWRGPHNQMIYTDGSTINPALDLAGRIEVTGNHGNGEYNLRIINLTHEDTGAYSCNGVVNGIRLQQSFQLQTIDRITANEGDDVCISFQLSFTFDGSVIHVTFNSAGFAILLVLPGEDIFIFHDLYKHRATYTGNTTASLISFCLHNLTVNDTGEYICDVMNKEYFAYLTVFVPLVEAIISPLRISTKESENITFQCISRSLPKAEISWHQGDKYLYGDSRYIDNITSSSSLLYAAKREDNGGRIYCIANNSRTVVESEKVLLNITYSPQAEIFPTGKVLTVVNGQKDIELNCTIVNANPGIKYYSWFKNGRPIQDKTDDTIMFPTILPYDKGTYGCQGNNGVGDGNISTIYIDVLPVPNHNVSTVSCNTSSTVTLSCTLEGYQRFYSPLYWIHHHDTVEIGTFPGKFIDNVFRLTLQFCNYMDLGLYTCIWKGDKSGLTDVNETINVIINGPPIITSKETKIESDKLIISVEFYSEPFPYEPVWYHNNKLVPFGSKYHRSTKSKSILLQQYDKEIYVNGFVSNLTIINFDGINGNTFACRIENSLGYVLEDVFPISEGLSRQIQTCSEGTSISVVAGTAVGCIVSTVILMLIVFLLVRRYGHKHSSGKNIAKEGKDNNGIEGYEEIGMSTTPNMYDSVVHT